MATKYSYPWERQGTNPFRDGVGGGYAGNPFRVSPTPVSSSMSDPYQQKADDAAHQNANLASKYEALSFDNTLGENTHALLNNTWQGAKDVGSAVIDNPVTRGINWVWHQTGDRVLNALEGGLEETRNYRNAQTVKQAKTGNNDYSFLDELGAGLGGIGKGLTHQNDYNLTRWLKNYSDDPVTGKRGAISSVLDVRPLELIKQNFNPENRSLSDVYSKSLGASGPQDPNSDLAGAKNVTLGDVFGFGVEAAAMNRLFPVKFGKTIKPGSATMIEDAAATNIAQSARSAEVQGLQRQAVRATQPTKDMVKILESSGVGSATELSGLTRGELQSLMSDLSQGVKKGADYGKNFWDDVGKVKGKDFSTAVDPVMKKVIGDPTVHSILKGNIFGKEFVPFANAQIATGEALGNTFKSALSHAPGVENFLAKFSNAVETTRTKGRSLLSGIVRDSKSGGKAVGDNLREKLSQQVKSTVGKLTPEEETALYYAITMGKQLDDPAFLQQLLEHKGIQFADTAATSSRLDPVRQWWAEQQKRFATAGETAGHFNAMDSEYLPVIRKKPMGAPGMTTGEQLGQEFGGLRSIQKTRELPVEELLKQSDTLAVDKFSEAVSRYGDIYGGLESRRFMLDNLERNGLGSWKPKSGMTDISNILKHGENGSVTSNPFYMKDTLKDPFAEHLLGYGGTKTQTGIAGAIKKLGRISEPLKSSFTTVNMSHHMKNNIDDLITNLFTDSGLPNAERLAASDFAALRNSVTRETPVAKGVNVRDWVKNADNQWEYSPGARTAMDLTAGDIQEFAKKTGITHNQSTSLNQWEGDSVFKKGLNKVRNITEKPNEAQRVANFTKNIRDFGDTEFARKATGQSLIDYGDLTPFQKDVVRPIMPFSTFAMKNPPVALQKMLQNPEIVTMIDKVRKNADSEGKAVYPIQFQGRPVIAIHDPKKKETTYLDLGLSQTDLGWMGQLNKPSELAKEVRQLLGPIPQAGIGYMTGTDQFNRSIETGSQPANWLDNILGTGITGPDGQRYVDNKSHFLTDTLMAGFKNPTGRIPATTMTDAQSQSSVLNQRNRMLQETLNKLTTAGHNVPTMQDLNKRNKNPFRR